MPPSIIIAGTHSNVGKTTIALGLMAALRQKYEVQPFKVGPDFIDPSHHTLVCSRPSRNLDTYLMGETGVRETFQKASEGADIAIIEGVMGLYDGLDSGEIASTAHVAKTLGAPVILVVSAQGTSRSLAAVIKGYLEFDSKVKISGVILNKVGSPRHAELIKAALQDADISLPVLGALPINKDITTPSRHLGLYMAHESRPSQEYLADIIEKNTELEKIVSIARSAPELNIKPKAKETIPIKTKIGVALDSAFCFYYQDTFEAFQSLGSELTFFSPLTDNLPEVDGLYLGGGYPELFAKELEKSKTREAIRKAAEDGMPIYGECGALLYLGDSLETDKTHSMAGVLSAHSRMTEKLQALGYTEGKIILDTAIAKRGTLIKGHEFHYSITQCDSDARFAYRLTRGKGIQEGKDGLFEHNTIASYMHSHPASLSLETFVKACEKYRRS